MDKYNLIKEKNEKEYRYSFGDGTGFTVCSTMFKEDGKRWIELLLRMDLDEQANNKKESRRHCSIDAFDPEGNTLASEEDMEELVTSNEMTAAFVRSLSEQEKQIYIGRFIEQLTQNEVAEKLGFTQGCIAKIEKRIREKYKNLKKF